MKKIPLTRGFFALVDDEDYEYLSRWNWHAVKTAPGVFYAARTQYNPVTQEKWMVLMHRQIMGALEGEDVDHQNRNRFDNQKYNLRRCSRGQNLAAKPTLLTRKGQKKSSPFRGVALHTQNGNWTAQISVCGKKKHIGSFALAIDAALAYDKAARELFGDFATPNFPVVSRK